MRYSVEHYDGAKAILTGDDGSECVLTDIRLPEGAGPGTILRRSQDGAWHIDVQETCARRQKALSLFRRLKARGSKG